MPPRRSALGQAFAAAKGKDVRIVGAASTLRQYLEVESIGFGGSL